MFKIKKFKLVDWNFKESEKCYLHKTNSFGLTLHKLLSAVALGRGQIYCLVEFSKLFVKASHTLLYTSQVEKKWFP